MISDRDPSGVEPSGSQSTTGQTYEPLESLMAEGDAAKDTEGKQPQASSKKGVHLPLERPHFHPQGAHEADE